MCKINLAAHDRRILPSCRWAKRPSFHLMVLFYHFIVEIVRL
jgi:hypothetical protein